MMKIKKLLSEQDTQAFAREVAKGLDVPTLIFLRGDLGMGKSVFARAFIRTLCANEGLEVPSPTFTLLQTYEAENGLPIYHYDLYRIKDPEEIYELDWEEACATGVVLVEWPARLGTLVPAPNIDIEFSPVPDEPNAREVRISHEN